MVDMDMTDSSSYRMKNCQNLSLLSDLHVVSMLNGGKKEGSMALYWAKTVIICKVYCIYNLLSMENFTYFTGF